MVRVMVGTIMMASATPPARTIDVVGGIEFAMITGPADLRLETAISQADEAVIASAVMNSAWRSRGTT